MLGITLEPQPCNLFIFLFLFLLIKTNSLEKKYTKKKKKISLSLTVFIIGISSGYHNHAHAELGSAWWINVGNSTHLQPATFSGPGWQIQEERGLPSLFSRLVSSCNHLKLNYTEKSENVFAPFKFFTWQAMVCIYDHCVQWSFLPWKVTPTTH